MKKEKKVSYQGKIYKVILDMKGGLFKKPSLEIWYWKNITPLIYDASIGQWCLIFREKSTNIARLSNMFENQIIKDKLWSLTKWGYILSEPEEKTDENIINLDEI